MAPFDVRWRIFKGFNIEAKEYQCNVDEHGVIRNMPFHAQDEFIIVI